VWKRLVKLGHLRAEGEVKELVGIRKLVLFFVIPVGFADALYEYIIDF